MGRTHSGWDCPPPRRRWRSRLLFRRTSLRGGPPGRHWHRIAVLRWPLRGLMWGLVGTAGWLLAGPEAVVAGLVLIEATVLALTLRRVRANRRHGGGWRPPDAGVREPRRPLPTSGVGAMALTVPGTPPA